MLQISPEQNNGAGGRLHVRDKGLADKLRAEWPGILQWAIEGCLKWQAQGLDQPRAVMDATKAYLEAEDVISAWIEERCELDANSWEPSATLFPSWKKWAELSGEFVGSQKQFGEKLETKGIIPARKHGGRRGYSGIRLLEAEPLQGKSWHADAW